GATQPQAHAQIIINIVDFGLNLQEAGDAPRIVHSGSTQPTDETMKDGGALSIESGFGDEIEKQLAKKGHNIKYEKGIFGGYQAIMLKDGSMISIKSLDEVTDGINYMQGTMNLISGEIKVEVYKVD
ncbi:gamma-glutamyltransferase, partial [Pseudomonadota bacterium]|nr:gamma-glutamyltransferase [Pseudomonadota bacterium]